jgi:hypothetical protein
MTNALVWTFSDANKPAEVMSQKLLKLEQQLLKKLEKSLKNRPKRYLPPLISEIFTSVFSKVQSPNTKLYRSGFTII